MGERRGRSRSTLRSLRVRGPVQFDAGFTFKGAEMLPSFTLVGLLDQQGVDAPGLTVGRNTIPGAITITRQAAGSYLLHFEGAPFAQPTIVLTQSPNPVAQVFASRVGDSDVLVETYEGGALTDEILINTPLLIYVFP